MKCRRPRLILYVAAAFALVAAMPAPAQDYPNRPIRFIVPYPPGGGTDVVARIVNEALAAELGQPIIIDNRGGAAGNVGTDIAAKAQDEGRTTVLEMMVTPELGDPFRRDALALPTRHLAKYQSTAELRAPICQL